MGETINIMTLGGLALAVGILVDDATVTIENIDNHLSRGEKLHDGILNGAAQIAVPALVSSLCICIVFLPMFQLTGVARYLFVPLAEAVVFAVMASYVLSRTLIPTLAMYLLSSHDAGHEEPEASKIARTAPKSGKPAGGTVHHGNDETGINQGSHIYRGEAKRALPDSVHHGTPKKEKKGRGFFSWIHHTFEEGFNRLRRGYTRLLDRALGAHWLFAIIFFLCCAASMALIPFLGQDFFPTVDAGQFKLHIRAKTGTRIEETARLCDQIEASIRKKIDPKDLDAILDNIGVPYSGINLSYSNSGVIGSADADIQVSLKPGHKPTADYQRQLRIDLPKEFPGTLFAFQPADIVSQILNFGLPAPIDIQLIGTHPTQSLDVARQIAQKLALVPGAVDVRVQQPYDGPRLDVKMDRSQAEQLGITGQQIAQSVLVSLSGSFQTAPTFYLDPTNGVEYNVAVQAPQYNIRSLQDLNNLPLKGANSNEVLANVATIGRSAEPAAIYHYNVKPVIDVFANVQDRDLGGVASDVNKIVGGVTNSLPKGTTAVVRGQVQTMNQSFKGLEVGLVFAIGLVYLLMVVNFQSWSEPFIIIMALPGALAGIVWMLFITGTTISVPALMGAIMCIGVATANSILVISFAKERLAAVGNARQAVLEAGTTRLRPVIMTALAMIIGMVPMSLGLGEGGEQNAPLGRAVIGGLLLATVATLFFVPTVYSIIHGGKDDHEDQGPTHEPEEEPAVQSGHTP